MSVDERTCNECGASNWTKVVDDAYPDRRRDRDKTVKTVYACDSCDSEARHFDQRNDGTEIFSGAMR